MQSSIQTPADSTRKMLRTGPQTAKSLMAALGASQPTVSRTLQALGDAVVRLGAARSIQYTLRDPARAALEAPIYRVSPAGQLREWGRLVPVCPEGFVLLGADGERRHSDGLPWWLFDMRPQGYLGRAYAQRHGAALGLPERLSDWQDTHVMRALLHQGADLPGDLLVGEVARVQFVNAPALAPIALAGKPAAYLEMAAAAARGDVAGSSAAGEQPKFTAYAEVEGGEAAHVLVKFTAATPGPVSERWRDLLLAEHLALHTLHQGGVPAARSALIDQGGQRFLEVRRFDRTGPLGRHALHSLAALDAEFAGVGHRWPDVAQALERARVITPDAREGACLLWAFGTLIGNTDMHGGNLSFMGEPPYGVAPAYDMTPMAFAPTAGGDLPERSLDPYIAPQVPAAVWQRALALAQAYMQRLLAAPGFSPRFGPCIATLQGHVALAAQRIARLGG
ncbi:MAG: type II toxin-antitoxin system HipA family toxin YjjJ [Acidovorax sp.]